MEEHTTTREELIGKQDDGDGGRRPSADSSASNGSNESDVKSWALDHAYVPNEIGKKFNLVMETGFSKNGFPNFGSAHKCGLFLIDNVFIIVGQDFFFSFWQKNFFFIVHFKNHQKWLEFGPNQENPGSTYKI